MRAVRLALIAVVLFASAHAASAQDRWLKFDLRGKQLDLAVYTPAGAPKGTVIMGSGDVGWVGLAAEMCDFLRGQGYLAIGVNSRQYLAAFTSGKQTVTTTQLPEDFGQIADLLRREHLLVSPVILSGVSEGAAFAVLAASLARNHSWVQGVVTMGIPPTAELGWRWVDFTSWITKKDANEPMFAPKDFIAKVAPIPLCMIQSRKDEYVTEADYTLLEATARSPKKLVLISASNHRFTDRKKELKEEFVRALAWVAAEQQAHSQTSLVSTQSSLAGFHN